MGNSISDVNDNLKAQAGGTDGGPELYKLLSMGGGGELYQLMKEAMHTKDYTQVDDVIKNQVVKFLYNEGKAEYVRIN